MCDSQTVHKLLCSVNVISFLQKETVLDRSICEDMQMNSNYEITASCSRPEGTPLYPLLASTPKEQQLEKSSSSEQASTSVQASTSMQSTTENQLHGNKGANIT